MDAFISFDTDSVVVCQVFVLAFGPPYALLCTENSA